MGVKLTLAQINSLYTMMTGCRRIGAPALKQVIADVYNRRAYDKNHDFTRKDNAEVVAYLEYLYANAELRFAEEKGNS
jgi:hypothetical protein